MSKGLWIPIEVLNKPGLTPTEKLFLSEIVQLDGVAKCYALNSHFADLFGVTRSRASQIISSLQTKGHIKSKLQYRGKEVIGRIITPSSKLKGVCRKPKGGISENELPPIEKREENKQSKKQSRQPFIPPTIGELTEYADSIGYTQFDAERFHQKYAGAGWKYPNGKPVTDWKRLMDGWQKNEKLPQAEPMSREVTEAEADELMKGIYTCS